MNYQTIRELEQKLRDVNSKIATAEETATSTTQKLSAEPRSSGGKVKSKVESGAIRVVMLLEEKTSLEHELAEAIKSIPESYQGRAVRLRVCKGYSWKRISYKLYGHPHAQDSIRMMCVRYRW